MIVHRSRAASLNIRSHRIVIRAGDALDSGTLEFDRRDARSSDGIGHVNDR